MCMCPRIHVCGACQRFAVGETFSARGWKIGAVLNVDVCRSMCLCMCLYTHVRAGVIMGTRMQHACMHACCACVCTCVGLRARAFVYHSFVYAYLRAQLHCIRMRLFVYVRIWALPHACCRTFRPSNCNSLIRIGRTGSHILMSGWVVPVVCHALISPSGALQ